MIHYHGCAGMILDGATRMLRARHAMISHNRPESLPLAAEVCQSFALDNGAFSVWRSGAKLDIPAYAEWAEAWRRHPGFDWCLIPDVIDGDEAANDELLCDWPLPRVCSVPVWHLHESIDRLQRLCDAWPRVAFGSSGEFSDPGGDRWWDRMAEALDRVCDGEGRPPCKFHGLRMMDPTLYSHVPFSSVDSSTVARNLGFDKKWDGHMYLRGLSKAARAMILAERMEMHATASTWTPRDVQTNFALLG